jgi:quinol monooxygenase YgiN
MLIVSGTYKIKPGKRDEFMKAIYDQGIYAEILKEKGNISYDYYYPYGNDTDVYFIERWSDRTAWDAHKVAPHIVKLQDIKNAYMTGFEPGILGEVKE